MSESSQENQLINQDCLKYNSNSDKFMTKYCNYSRNKQTFKPNCLKGNVSFQKPQSYNKTQGAKRIIG